LYHLALIFFNKSERTGRDQLSILPWMLVSQRVTFKQWTDQ